MKELAYVSSGVLHCNEICERCCELCYLMCIILLHYCLGILSCMYALRDRVILMRYDVLFVEPDDDTEKARVNILTNMKRFRPKNVSWL